MEINNPAFHAEKTVIGSVMSNGAEAFDVASRIISTNDFESPQHKLIWRVLENLVNAGKSVDPLCVWDVLRINGDFMGDLPTLCDYAMNYSLGLLGTRDYARLVAAASKQNALKKAGYDVVGLISDETISIEQRVGQSVTILEKVIDERPSHDPRKIGDFAVSFIDDISDLADGKVIPARATHIPLLDKYCSGGLRDDQLVVIAARPSVGKSSFALQLCISSAKQDAVPVAFFGMEMSNKAITNRTVANFGRVSLQSLKTGHLDEEGWSRIAEAVEAIKDLRLYLYDQAAMTLSEVVSKTRSVTRKYGVKTVVVDYLQLMKGSGRKNADRRTELEEITRGLKQLAKQLGITVILLSQLNRDVEKRTNPRPQMSDLKECGAIEEDADIVIGLWTHKKGENDMGDIKGATVLKNRDGETGELALHFEGKYQRWTESTTSLHQPSPSSGAKTSERKLAFL